MNIRHLFPVGEVNGSHGVYRPGGSALNAGQVGGLRAAEYIAHRYADWSLAEPRGRWRPPAGGRRGVGVDRAMLPGERTPWQEHREVLQQRMTPRRRPRPLRRGAGKGRGRGLAAVRGDRTLGQFLRRAPASWPRPSATANCVSPTPSTSTPSVSPWPAAWAAAGRPSCWSPAACGSTTGWTTPGGLPRKSPPSARRSWRPSSCRRHGPAPVGRPPAAARDRRLVRDRLGAIPQRRNLPDKIGWLCRLFLIFRAAAADIQAMRRVSRSWAFGLVAMDGQFRKLLLAARCLALLATAGCGRLGLCGRCQPCDPGGAGPAGYCGEIPRFHPVPTQPVFAPRSYAVATYPRAAGVEQLPRASNPLCLRRKSLRTSRAGTDSGAARHGTTVLRRSGCPSTA